jgi:hypothetical protein
VDYHNYNDNNNNQDNNDQDDQDNQDNQDIQDNQDNQDNQNKTHPDKIAGLAQDQREKFNQENDKDNQDHPNLQEQQDLPQNASENVPHEFKDANKIEIEFETDNNLETGKEQEQEDPPFDCLIRTQSGRVSRPVHKYVTTHQSYLQSQALDLV